MTPFSLINSDLTELDTNKVNISDIVNNLSSTSTNKPLSANMGKGLNDNKINARTFKIRLNATTTKQSLEITSNINSYGFRTIHGITFSFAVVGGDSTTALNFDNAYMPEVKLYSNSSHNKYFLIYKNGANGSIDVYVTITGIL